MPDKFYFIGKAVENSILMGKMDNTKGWTMETNSLLVTRKRSDLSGQKGNIYLFSRESYAEHI